VVAGECTRLERFLQRMPAEIARYRALGIEYADGAFAPASP